MKSRVVKLILFFHALISSGFGAEGSRDASLGSCLKLAKSLQEAGDPVSSLIIYNMIKVKKMNKKMMLFI